MKVLGNFHSLEQNFHGTFATWTFGSRCGLFVPGVKSYGSKKPRTNCAISVGHISLSYFYSIRLSSFNVVVSLLIC